MKVIAMMPVYNEADIVEIILEHLTSQGIQVVIVDSSTDGSYDICAKFLGKGVISLEFLAMESFDYDFLLDRLYRKALEAGADWVLLNNADEYLESPYPGLTLKEAMEKEDSKGRNMIQFNNFEFLPTEKDEGSTEKDVRKRLKYYTWNDSLHFHGWKVYPGIVVTGTCGHYPVFPKNVKVKVARTKYVMRHYRLRSHQHGLRKVFDERLPRFSQEQREKGMLVQYDKFGRDKKYFVINSRNLNKYNDDGRWIKRKKFDFTWGHKPIPWAKPPAVSMRDRIATLPFYKTACRIFLFKQEPLPSEDQPA